MSLNTSKKRKIENCRDDSFIYNTDNVKILKTDANKSDRNCLEVNDGEHLQCSQGMESEHTQVTQLFKEETQSDQFKSQLTRIYNNSLGDHGQRNLDDFDNQASEYGPKDYFVSSNDCSKCKEVESCGNSVNDKDEIKDDKDDHDGKDEDECMIDGNKICGQEHDIDDNIGDTYAEEVIYDDCGDEDGSYGPFYDFYGEYYDNYDYEKEYEYGDGVDDATLDSLKCMIFDLIYNTKKGNGLGSQDAEQYLVALLGLCTIDQRREVMQVTNNTHTPLSLACRFKNLPLVKFLVEHCDANVNGGDDVFGGRPLLCAIINGAEDIVHYLLECNADIGLSIGHGDHLNFLMVSLRVFPDEEFQYVGYKHTRENNVSDWYINESENDIESLVTGRIQIRPELVKLLIDNGALEKCSEEQVFHILTHAFKEDSDIDKKSLQHILDNISMDIPNVRNSEGMSVLGYEMIHRSHKMSGYLKPYLENVCNIEDANVHIFQRVPFYDNQYFAQTFDKVETNVDEILDSFTIDEETNEFVLEEIDEEDLLDYEYVHPALYFASAGLATLYHKCLMSPDIPLKVKVESLDVLGSFCYTCKFPVTAGKCWSASLEIRQAAKSGDDKKQKTETKDKIDKSVSKEEKRNNSCESNGENTGNDDRKDNTCVKTEDEMDYTKNGDKTDITSKKDMIENTSTSSGENKICKNKAEMESTTKHETTNEEDKRRMDFTTKAKVSGDKTNDTTTNETSFKGKTADEGTDLNNDTKEMSTKISKDETDSNAMNGLADIGISNDTKGTSTSEERIGVVNDESLNAQTPEIKEEVGEKVNDAGETDPETQTLKISASVKFRNDTNEDMTESTKNEDEKTGAEDLRKKSNEENKTESRYKIINIPMNIPEDDSKWDIPSRVEERANEESAANLSFVVDAVLPQYGQLSGFERFSKYYEIIAKRAIQLVVRSYNEHVRENKVPDLSCTPFYPSFTIPQFVIMDQLPIPMTTCLPLNPTKNPIEGEVAIALKCAQIREQYIGYGDFRTLYAFKNYGKELEKVGRHLELATFIVYCYPYFIQDIPNSKWSNEKKNSFQWFILKLIELVTKENLRSKLNFDLLMAIWKCFYLECCVTPMNQRKFLEFAPLLVMIKILHTREKSVNECKRFSQFLLQVVKSDIRNLYGQSLLHHVVTTYSSEGMVEYLSFGTELRELTNYFCGSVEMIKLLIAHGANVNAFDMEGMTPLGFSYFVMLIDNDDPDEDRDSPQDIVETLLAGGAHPDCADHVCITPIESSQYSMVPLCPVANRTLQCLSAIVIVDAQIDYQEHLPQHLVEFVQLHGPHGESTNQNFPEQLFGTTDILPPPIDDIFGF